MSNMPTNLDAAARAWGSAIPTVAALLLSAATASAQAKPFPQNTGYGRGFLPASIVAADAKAIHQAWKATYLKSDCGNGTYRVEFNGPAGSTVSEGMGYGMLLTAYHGDKAEFDGLWKFAQKNLNASHLMGWHVTCAGPTASDGGDSSATDGDEDIAFGLVVAVDQWGSE